MKGVLIREQKFTQNDANSTQNTQAKQAYIIHTLSIHIYIPYIGEYGAQILQFNN